MPNWCYNTITIDGDNRNLNILKEKLNKIIEEDKHIMNNLLFDVEQNKSTWYEDNLHNLGTKWDFKEKDTALLEINDDKILIYVQTAWSPPISFLIKLCEKFNVNANILYCEPGNDFAGQAIINDDGTHTDNCYSYYEGLYRLFDNFWEELSLNFEDGIDVSVEEFLSWFPFIINENEIQDLKDLYNEVNAFRDNDLGDLLSSGSTSFN